MVKRFELRYSNGISRLGICDSMYWVPRNARSRTRDRASKINAIGEHRRNRSLSRLGLRDGAVSFLVNYKPDTQRVSLRTV